MTEKANDQSILAVLMKSTKHKRTSELVRSRNILVSITIKAKNQGIKPWKESPLGQHGFNLVGMATCFVVKTMYQLLYDELVDYRSDLPILLKTLSLKRVQSRSALQNAFSRISKEFLT